MKKNNQQRRWELALHEAAHAASVQRTRNAKIGRIAVGLGAFDNISMGTLQGICRWESIDGGPVNLRAQIATSLAGPAQDEILGIKFDPYDSDSRQADSAAVRIRMDTGEDDGELMTYGWRQARQLVQCYAPAIRALARELMEARYMELSGEEASRILAANGCEPITDPEPAPVPQRSAPPSVARVQTAGPASAPPPAPYIVYERPDGRLFRTMRPEIPGREFEAVYVREDGYVR